MIVRYHKKFEKRYRKLHPRVQEKVKKTIDTFKDNPFEASLHNHPLHGTMQGRRAISVTGDLRIVFEEHDSYVVVIMFDVGTHSQIYN